MQLEIKQQETVPIPTSAGNSMVSFPQREPEDLSSQGVLYSLHEQVQK